MADNRANRANSETPADAPRTDASRAEADDVRKSDSKLRLVTPDAIFPEELEPNDESPTMISKSPSRSDINPVRDTYDLKGHKLAHFELGQAIGVGGMAAVYKARDSQLDRHVALKILPPPMARDPENIRRFHQEARAAARLDHENVARVFFCGEDQGLHFIAFEYVEGDNLRTILERRGRLPWAEAVRYVLQVATGLEHATTRGVVHRDIKPSNIIITPGGRAKIVDMGLARSLEPHADNGLTQSGVTLGTFDYIAPEQALEPRDADCRSDLYSLGCTFYHMITGQAPVPEGTAAKKLQHHQHVAPTDPRQLNPDVPDDVARILSKMMAKNPRDRYQRPIQLVQHLMQVARAAGDDSNVEQLFVDVQVPLAPKRRPMLLVSLAAVALGALLFVLSLAPQPQRKAVDPPLKAGSNGAANLLAKNAVENLPNIPTPAATEINNEDDLLLAIKSAGDAKNGALPIALTKDIVLSGKVNIAGASHSRQIVIAATDKHPVRLTLKLDKAPTSPLAAVRIAGGNVAFKNVRFEIVAGDGVKRLEAPVAAVAVNDGGTVDFYRCSFEQMGQAFDPSIDRERYAPQQGTPLATSLLVNPGSKSTAGTVTVRESYFPSGQVAVGVFGPGKVLLSDCAFFALGNLFQLKRGGDPAVVHLEHCSAYLQHGPAFRIDADTASQLMVDYCLFSVPDNATNREELDLVWQNGAFDPTKVSYKGQYNAYHGLNALWAHPGKVVAPGDTMKPFLATIAEAKLPAQRGYDKESRVLPRDPAPFKYAATAHSAAPSKAFQLADASELQLPPSRSNTHPTVGIRQCLDFKIDLPAPLVEPGPVVNEYKPAANEKVVDPSYLGKTPGYFTSFENALANARAGDVITLKAGDGQPFAIKPTTRETADLTIRGFPNSPPPTLTLDDTLDPEPCLFRLRSCKLNLENLNLLLESARDRRSWSLVAMDGGAACGFKGCVVTFKPRDRAHPKGSLSVVSIAADDGKSMMEARPSASGAAVTLQDCFVRGDGDFIALGGSRPINVLVEKSLLLLGGSFVHQMQCATEKVAGADANLSLRFKDSAFFFADPLLWLQAGKGPSRHQHPVRVEQADRCLFATLANRPLVSLETPEIVSDKNLAQFFEWKGQGNAFVQFDGEKAETSLLDYVPADDALRAFQFDEQRWKENFDANPETCLYVPMGFKTLPARPLSQAMPDDAVVHAEAPSLQPYLTQLPRFQVPKN